jgi:putative periplasmic protein
LLLHFLPTFKIGDTELREIDILSDLSRQKKELKDVIPAPKTPSTTLALEKDGKVINFKEQWPKGTERIVDYSEGKPGGMDHFYEQLTALKEKKNLGRPVRIAYFGDSFIEGDILLADLREALQKYYGGEGVGWLDAGNDLNQYKHTTTQKFTGLTEHLVKKPDSYDVLQAGMAERYYPLSGRANISLAPFMAHEYPRTEKWNTTQLYLRAKNGASVTFHIDGGKSTTEQVSPSPNVQMVRFNGATSHASIDISGTNATLFATAQEGNGGIVLDNFSMRGSNGLSLSKLPETTLRQFAQVRPYDLIVFQFGANAITPASKERELQTYTSKMKSVIQLFHKCFPTASILVIGAPDRGSKSSPDGTMEGVKMLVGYQDQMASDCKVGFYSLYKAMGGPGTMMRLVDEKNMGSKDYVHINFKGGKYVAPRIFKSIVAGQNNYARKMKLIQK